MLFFLSVFLLLSYSPDHSLHQYVINNAHQRHCVRDVIANQAEVDLTRHTHELQAAVQLRQQQACAYQSQQSVQNSIAETIGEAAVQSSERLPPKGIATDIPKELRARWQVSQAPQSFQAGACRYWDGSHSVRCTRR